MAQTNMAPPTLDQVEDQIKDVVNDLYKLMVESIDHQGSPTSAAMKHDIASLVEHLRLLSQTAPALPVNVPPEIIMYIEKGRNPDIYNREFVEVVQRQNQMLKGKAEAYAQFRDILAREIASAMPDVEEEVIKVVESTGGKLEK